MRLLLLTVILAGSGLAAGPLAVVTPLLSDTDGGAALPSSFTHSPGEVMFFSFQVDGYKTAADKVHLTYKLQALDPHGVPFIEPVNGEVVETLSPEDRNWKPTVRQEITLPPLADSGTYKLVVEITDELSKATTTKEVSLDVRGHRVDPSDTLVVRNFHFYRSEQDPAPLSQAAYRPGDALWARFDVIGFKYGEGNAIDVSYDVAVAGAGGKILWSQPEAAVDKGHSFYPKRYVPGSMSLTLQPNIHPGDYTVVITVHDRVGNQTCEARDDFTIQ